MPSTTVSITATVQGAIEAFGQAAKAMNEAVSAMKKDLAGLGTESKKSGEETASGFERMEKSLKAFKKEQVGEGKLVGFYVKELAEFTTLSEGAKSALGNLAQVGLALASGSVFGVAFEGIKFIVTAIREHSENAKRELEGLAGAVEKVISKARAAKAGTAAVWADTQMEGGKEAEPEGKRYKEAKDDVEEYKQKEAELNTTLEETRRMHQQGLVDMNAVQMAEEALALIVKAREAAEKQQFESWAKIVQQKKAMKEGLDEVNEAPFVSGVSPGTNPSAKSLQKAEADALRQQQEAEYAQIRAQDEERRRMQQQTYQEGLAALQSEGRVLAQARDARIAARAQELQQILASLDVEEAAVREKYRRGELSAQEEAAQIIALEQQKLEAKRAAYNADLQENLLYTNKKAEINRQVAQAEIEYTRQVTAAQSQLRQQQEANVQNFMQPFVRGFQDGIQKIMTRSITFAQAMRGLFGMLRQAFAQAISQMLSDWVAMLARKLANWVAEKALELAIHQSSETAGTTATVTNATTRTAAHAVEGGAAAGASAASNGPYGWMIAIPVALAVMGGLMALMSSISAAGGYDIPTGVNPVVQAHQEEMILPAKYANPLRRALLGSEGGGLGGSAGPLVVNVHVKGVIDGNHLVRTLTSNEGQRAITAAINKAARNGRKTA